MAVTKISVLTSCLLLLAGCGGGGGGSASNDSPTTAAATGANSQSHEAESPSSSSNTGSSNSSNSTPQVASPAPTVQPQEQALEVRPQPFDCAIGAITCVEVASTSSASTAQSTVPVTFGQVFRPGDLTNGQTLIARDGNGGTLPLQMDAVSTRGDGSVRFAVLSSSLSNVQAGERRIVNLYRSNLPKASAVAPNVSNYSFDISARIYKPQVTRVQFGDRATPFNVGQVMRLVLRNGQQTESYDVTITSDMSGSGFQYFQKIAEAFHAQINNNSQSVFRSIRPMGAYENIYLTTRSPDTGAFQIETTYTGPAQFSTESIQSFGAPSNWTVSAASALASAVATNARKHLSGPLANEYTLVLPFKQEGTDTSHPQLTARLHVRLYDGGARARTDMVIENNWAYNPDPGNLTYELTVKQNNNVVLHQPAFTHNHHSRWHKIFWQGSEPMARVTHHAPYLARSKVLFNYDVTLPIPDSVLESEKTSLANSDTSLMGNAFILRYFGTTGARAEIGPYPRWTALFLITQDERAKQSMLVNADAAAGIPIHYRDAEDDLPLNLDRRPGVTAKFGTATPQDALPSMTYSQTDWSPDTAHQGSFAFVPYLITGDVFYLDEITFWAAWNMAIVNPGYRGGSQGLINSDQLRGQAWALRSIGEAARALPDDHPSRSYFHSKLLNNLNWYASQYSEGSSAVSPLGAMEVGGTNAPWQQDFMTIVVSQLINDGYRDEAQSFFNFITKFAVGRFENHPQYCMQQAPAYYLSLRDATTNNYLSTWDGLFKRNFGNVECSSFTTVNGSPTAPNGYAANARAMLAAAHTAGHPSALTAHNNFVNNYTPDMRPSFLTNPTWALVPEQ